MRVMPPVAKRIDIDSTSVFIFEYLRLNGIRRGGCPDLGMRATYTGSHPQIQPLSTVIPNEPYLLEVRYVAQRTCFP
jgi:hypothetical protein